MKVLYSSLIWFIAFSVAVSLPSLVDVNKECIARNNGTTSNDYLLGTWYQVYKFILFGSLRSCYCPNVTFSRPTEEELRGYRDKYGSIDLPHTITDDAVVVDDGDVKGLLLEGFQAKTYIIDPKAVVWSSLEGYEIYIYRQVSDKYMIFWQCSSRGHVKFLMAKDKDAPEEELQKIITERPEITNKDSGVRYCNASCYNQHYAEQTNW